MTAYLNDGSGEAPKLRVYLNADNLEDPPEGSAWPGPEGPAAAERLHRGGFEGIQIGNSDTLAAEDAGDLPYCGLDRVDSPGQADEVFARHVSRGDNCLTLHVGTGMEDDDAVDRLLEAVLAAADKHRLPAFVETHRATITQDLWRTVRMTDRFPEIRFNGDFSHFYCGQELVYGDFEAKLDFLAPVFERVGFLHGRIAAPGFMQAPIESIDAKPRMAVGVDYLAHFKEIWRRAMRGFQANAGPGDVLVFAPELLRSDIYYARVFPDADGRLREESDRYREALLYAELARRLFAGA